MTKPIPAQMGAAVPARYDDDVIAQVRRFEHAQDNRACAAFAIVVFDLGAIRQNHRPSVMRGLGKLLAAFKRFDKCLRV